jgi:predicted ATPase
MKIKTIKFERHPILKDLSIDLTSVDGKPVDTIIFAGENGTGKSTILNAIYDFSTFKIDALTLNEKRTFKVELNNEEILIIKSHDQISKLVNDKIQGNEFVFSFEFPFDNWNQISTNCTLADGKNIKIPSNYFHHKSIIPIFSALFSDVEINFNPGVIKATTAIEVDQKITTSKRTSTSLANEITQMIIDIQSSDANDYLQYAENNIGGQIEKRHLQMRISRFKEAFSYIFEQKRYKCVKNIGGAKSVIFEDNGVEIPISALSSGEKQIVFRGSFLLKDQKSSTGALVLVDEPEISLHPKWQLKIVDYYKRLFTNEEGNQTSQIFIVTHSPFVIHNKNRCNDKVIILKKDSQGVISTSENQTFYSWTPEELIEKAFNINSFKGNQSPLIITEGKTDWKHLKKAFLKLQSQEDFQNLEFEFLEYEDDKIVNGESGLQKICEHVSKIPKDKPVICLFDRDIQRTINLMHDEDLGFKKWGNRTYSFCIPVPIFRHGFKYIVIESYYQDNEIKTKDKNGRRLFLTSEFKEKSGKHRDDARINYSKISYLKNNTDLINSKIIDSCVYDTDENNLALSKSDFAINILNGTDEFSNIDSTEFIAVLKVIKQIKEDDCPN